MSGLDELSQLPVPVPPPPSAALEAELATLAPVRTRRPVRQLVVLSAVSLVYAGAIFVALSLRRDLHELPIVPSVCVGLTWVVGFIAPLYLATVPRAGQVIPRWQLAGVASLIGAIGFIVLGLLIHPSGPHSVALEDHVAPGYGCFEFGLATALVPVVIGAMFLRGALPVGSRWVAAALGAGGGSLGGLMLNLHCSVTDGAHVGLMHGGVVAVSALLAAALLPRVTNLR